MNSTTPAYSVVAFLLILGSTLLALPTSVFSQSDLEVTEVSQEPAEEALEAAPSGPADPYRRIKLPGNNEVYSDFVVGPGRFELELAPGESKTVEIGISNRMGVPKRFSIETEDAGGSDDVSKTLVLLGEDTGPYTVKDYISVPNEQFDLDHSYRAVVPVTISLPADAPPGGRYGSLLVSIVSDVNEEDETDSATAASVVISRIGVLFFISNPGDTTPASELKDFATIGQQKFYSESPVSFGITHENTGDVHLTPYGEIRIANMFGDEVGFVQLDPWFILPQSLRTREVSWERELLIGRYTATTFINRGYDDIIDEASYVFWVFPWKILVAVFAGLFLLFLMLRFIGSRFEFKRK
jgi:hypothetical protein